MNTTIKESVQKGKNSLGIELGSTRIKSVLIDETGAVLASGSYTWENQLQQGVWTYQLDDVWVGIQESYRNLCKSIREQYKIELTTVGVIGFSAMMHGYLAFDKNENQVAQFRTWRNTITGEAAEKLTDEFSFNIPQRWSIAHLYQAIINDEEHVKDIAFLTTLAGYVHWKLTGKRVLGIGDASGMFPINSSTNNYDADMMNCFNALISGQNFSWKLADILPEILGAGEKAGNLTDTGALLIDPTGRLMSGIPLCPPEGDAGTGMVATNSVAAGTGNISAGTSIFAMIVLEKSLSQVHEEIDMVTTPSGFPVAMVHCNNCSSDIDAWAQVLLESYEALGFKTSIGKVLDSIYFQALEGDADCGGLLSYNYLSGETITNMNEGRPLFARMPDAKFTFANFARAQLYAAIATLKLGMNILTDEEKVHVTSLQGHGGYFKAKGVGQKLMAGALRVPVTVMETAGEGGPWGMALLALYMKYKAEDESLENFLNNHIFTSSNTTTVQPDKTDIKGFETYMELYVKGLDVEDSAIRNMR